MMYGDYVVWNGCDFHSVLVAWGAESEGVFTQRVAGSFYLSHILE